MQIKGLLGLISASIFTVAILASPASLAGPFTKKSLYERLGGEEAIAKVVDDFAGRASKDSKVNFFRGGIYKGIDVDRLKHHLVTFISSATGGKQKYEGRDMKTAHVGMKITQAEFDAIVLDLEKSLKHLKVRKTERDELLVIAKSTADDIVETK